MSATRSTVNLSESCSWLRETKAASGMPLGGTIEVPVRIGPVELLRQVGEGGMGVVWAARHEVLRRDVAVKFLLSSGTGAGAGSAGGSDAAEMFVQGARAAAAVRHAGLTTVHDAGVVNGVPYVVMEFIDGPTLSEVLRRGPVSMGVVRAVLERVCEAVEELHASDLVHRDIKPGNIMLTRRGEVMVTDFGLACPRLVRGGGDGGMVGGVSGTPAYMAPEMFKGEVSARTDVYAIGATAFELLTRGAPYQGTVGELREAAEKGVVPVERLEACGVPEDVRRGIERCMNKEAIYRPRSAGRAWEVFRAAFDGAKPMVRGASREEMVRLAERAVEAGGATGSSVVEPKLTEAQAPIAKTMFGLISTWAEKKRKSGPVVGEGEKASAEAKPAEREVAAPPIANVRPKGTVCGACGYSMEGLAGARCPECGAVVRVRTTASAPPTTPVARPRRERALPRSMKTGRVVAPIPWLWVAACSIAAGVAGGLVVGVVDRYHVFPQHVPEYVAKWLGLYDHTSGPVTFGTLVFPGRAPPYLDAIVMLSLRISPFVLIGALTVAAYRRLAFLMRGPGAGVMCGWCQYDLAGNTSGKCPECGHGMDDRGKRGERPPARRWGLQVRVLGVSLMAAAIACVGSLMVGMMLANWALKDWPRFWLNFTAGAVVGVPAAMAGLVAYHLSARGTALLRGRAVCGRCGAKGSALVDGRCTRCKGEGERAEERKA
jgi:serine/threonine-protein kinase